MGAPIPLSFGAGGARAIALAPLTGADEAAGADAVTLLRRLALPGRGLVHGAALDALTAGDRDRAVAGLYAQIYGADIRADAVCTACAARYEIRFDLTALQRGRVPDGSAAGDPPAIDLDGARLRLPTLADLAGTPADLLARLLIDGAAPDPARAEAALEAADPALELDLAATCPECDAGQAVPFSICRFLRAALQRDRAFLMREVHLIASTYRWSLGEILGLGRADRQSFARLLIAEREAAALPARRVS